jgi:hypothetical protein
MLAAEAVTASVWAQESTGRLSGQTEQECGNDVVEVIVGDQ